MFEDSGQWSPASLLPNDEVSMRIHPSHVRSCLVSAVLLVAGWSWAIQKPVVDSFTASGTTIAPGGSITLSLSAHDPDCPAACTTGCGQVIRADLTAWSSNGGTYASASNGTSGSPYLASAQWQAPPTEGEYTLTVSISDSGTYMCGGRQTAAASLSVLVTSSNNHAPVVDVLTADPGTILISAASSLSCIAHDPDSDPLTYVWSTTLGTIAPGVGGAAAFTAPAVPGIAAVTCRARDSHGAFADGTVNVTGVQADHAIAAGFYAPVRVAEDNEGYVFVVEDRAPVVKAFHVASGEPAFTVPMPGVTSIAVDWNDNLLLGTGSGAYVVDRKGAILTTLAAVPPLNAIQDVAADSSNRRYAVLEAHTGRTAVFQSDGTFQGAWGSTGSGTTQFKAAVSLAVNADGNLLVGDQGSGQIKVFDTGGNLLGVFGAPGSGAGQFTRLTGLAVDGGGYVYAADAFQSRVQIFNPDGTLREIFGNYGSGLGELMTPVGIAVSPASSRIVVASLNAARLEVYALQNAAPPLLNTAPTPATPVSPTNGQVLAPSSSVSLTVSNAYDPDLQSLQYTFQLFRIIGGTPALQNTWTVSEGSGTTAVDATAFVSSIGQYLWRVNVSDGIAASGWTGDQSFQISSGGTNHAPDVPQPLAPVMDAEVSDLTPTLVLQNAGDSDGDGLYYQFEAARYDGAAFATLAQSAVVSQGTPDTVWQIPAGLLDRSQRLYWRARSYDGRLYSGWSAYAFFWTAPFTIPEAGEYGNLPTGDRTRPEGVRYRLGSLAGGLTLYLQGYHRTTEDALTLVVNGHHYAVPQQTDEGWSDTFDITINAGDVNADGENDFFFVHSGPAGDWGVRKVGLVAPPVPILAAVPYNTVIDIGWSPGASVPAGTQLRLYRGLGAGDPGVAVGDFNPALMLVRDVGLSNGTLYSYHAVYVNLDGVEGRPSNTLSIAPSDGDPTPVTDLRVGKTGMDVVLQWTPITTAQGIQAYAVYRDLMGNWVPDTSDFTNQIGLQGSLTGTYADIGEVPVTRTIWYSIVPVLDDGERVTP